MIVTELRYQSKKIKKRKCDQSNGQPDKPARISLQLRSRLRCILGYANLKSHLCKLKMRWLVEKVGGVNEPLNVGGGIRRQTLFGIIRNNISIYVINFFGKLFWRHHNSKKCKQANI
jgi:hypothetical protein